MKFISLCSGIEAASVAFNPLGWEAICFAEIEPFPSALLQERFPHVPNMGDMSRYDEWPEEFFADADMIVGGPPCFTAGHLVLSETGYVPIETLRPGDKVITHKGRLRKVVRIGSKLAEVGEMRGVGIREPIVSTPGHPFLSVHYRNQNTKRNGSYTKVEHVGSPEWIDAKDMPGRQWCALTEYEAFDDYTVESSKFLPKEAMYVAGMYVGDGYIRGWKGKTKKAVVLTVNPEKYKKLKAVIGNAVHTVANEKRVVRITISDTKFAEWLDREFGRLSHLKKIPSWVYGSEYRSEFLRGYLDADGCLSEDKVSVSTTSRSLAYGVSDLLNSEGYVASVGFVKTPDQCVIEGRTVNQRDYYLVQAYPLGTSRKARVKHELLLRSVRSFNLTGTDTVFNIEVEGDHSYVVNGAIVHNCQSFSVAGKRGGLDDDRGNLTLTFTELIDHADAIRHKHGKPPVIVLYENVPGLLSDKTNAFGCLLGALAGEDDQLNPSGQRWTNAGAVLGPERSIAWRILDAQYFGLAQRRKRVFVIASAREWFSPSEILFEYDGVRRDIAPSRETGQETTGNVGTGFTPSSFGQYREGTGTLRASGGDLGGGSETLVAGAGAKNTGFRKLTFESYVQDETASTMMARDYKSYTDLVAFSSRQDPVSGDVFGALDTGSPQAQAVAYGCTPTKLNDVANTITASYGQGGVDLETKPLALVTAVDRHAVAIAGTQNDAFRDATDNLAPTLRSGSGGGVVNQAVATPTAVRRLTPIECERLQGFPDGYTAIPWRNKPASECPDGHRYKALGNSWAVPVVYWIGKRIANFLDDTEITW